MHEQELELRSYELKMVKLQNCRCLRSLQMPSYTSQVTICQKYSLLLVRCGRASVRRNQGLQIQL